MAIGDPFGSGFAELINTLNDGNPLFLQSNDSSSLSIVNVKLVGAENYKMRATTMKIALKGKSKMGIIDGTCVKKESSVVLSQQWERCNVILLRWILGSLTQELYVGQVYSEIAFEVWTGLKETYAKMDGEFDILTILHACVSEGRIACTYDAKSGSANHTQLIRLMHFLMGLNDVYQLIRSTILAMDHLLNVKDAFYVVSREESHRRLHPCSSGNNKSQPAAFVVKTNNNTKNFNSRVNTNNNNNTNRGPNPNLICKNCGLIGHNVDIFNGNSKANQYVPSTSGSLSSSFLVPFKLRLIKSANEFDVLNEFEVHSLKFFDTQRPKRPYDEEGGTPNMESNGRVASDECDITVDDEAATIATQIRENIPSEGNVHSNQNGEDPTNILEISLVLRRSSRQRNMPSELNDFIVGSSVRYGLEKYVCYSKLSGTNFCFSTILNKNNSYVLAHLPPGRKVKGCKWIWNIKYKASGEAVSKKQATISRSSAESEYKCLTSTTFFHEKTKHFEIGLQLVREKDSSGVIKIMKVASANNVADSFTKGLSIAQHNEFCEKLSLMVYISARTNPALYCLYLAGLATARMSMQDAPQGVPINRATRFENKVGSLDLVASESLIKKQGLA
ncbi:ribonuclease H-like domain-containing protein [Tanacetum coccineum]